MKVFTIGFTKKSARVFFENLKQSGAQRVIDVRLNNVSQLAAFAKRDDLEFFLREICGIGYLHLEYLAPTQNMLNRYKKEKGTWATYERDFLDLMESRRIEEVISDDILAGGCLLCSEHQPHKCHRRLVIEYLKDHGWDLDVSHLV